MIHGRPGLAAAVEGCGRQPQLPLRAVAQMAVAADGRCQPTTSGQGEIRQPRAQFGWRRKGLRLIDHCP